MARSLVDKPPLLVEETGITGLDARLGALLEEIEAAPTSERLLGLARTLQKAAAPAAELTFADIMELGFARMPWRLTLRPFL
jgi:hypothetical protein